MTRNTALQRSLSARWLLTLLGVVLLMVPSGANAYNNSSLKWYTLTTERFQVHYHEGAEWTARAVAEIAEEVHGPLTELYGYEPDAPVHFVIKDTDDYANGAAYFYDNRVEIWATNLEFGFRGTMDWLRNVVTHEYTHIISIQASIKMPRRIPAIYLQFVGFETEKRSDVLNGYPNLIATYPISGVGMPPWYAEGIAQYQSPDKRYDCWDTHRDMILRSAVIDDKMLSYTEMGFFGKSSLQSEQVYDHGYGLVRYIADTYGTEAIVEITRELGGALTLNMDQALERVTGKKGEAIYRAWRASLERRYDRQLSDIRDSATTGTRIAPTSDISKAQDPNDFQDIAAPGHHACGRCGMVFNAEDGPAGFMTIAPTYSHDGNRIALLSNKGSDFSGTAMFVMDAGGENLKMLKPGVASRPRFSPDDSKLLYSRKHKVNKYGVNVNDLFVYDIAKKKEKRITRAGRCGDPEWSPDGRQIITVKNGDGTHELMRMNADGSNPQTLYRSAAGTQIYNPQYSPDGHKILFGVFEAVSRDIAMINADGSGFEYVLQTVNDERDARWADGGKSIVFACDRTGIFNIYRLNVANGSLEQLTQVLGGAFMPDLAPDGDRLVYSLYGSEGYNVMELKQPRALVTYDSSTFADRASGEFDECADLRAAAAMSTHSTGDVASLSSDGSVPEGSATSAAAVKAVGQKYKPQYTAFQLYPRFVLYDKVARFGLFMNSYEVLDKQNLFLAGSYGTNGEFDGYLRFEVRNLWPTLWGEFFLVREKAKDTGFDDDPTSQFFEHSFDFDLRYDLWQAEFGLTFELGPTLSLTSQNDVSVYWSHGEYRVNVDVEEVDEGGVRQPPSDGGWKYYTGDQAHLVYNFRQIGRALDADINPRGGRALRFHYFRSFDDLFQNGEFAYAFRPVFSENHYNQFELDWREYIGLPWLDHSLRIRLSGAVIDENVDDFFWNYVGGLDGIRGYSFYSIGGRKSVLGSVTYRFPILRNINKQFLHILFRDLYGGIFYEAANAWQEDEFKTTDYKKSLGYELRLRLGSYYIFPTAITFASAYAFDEVTFDEEGFGALNAQITQEKGFRYYLTVGFDFGL